MNDELWEILKNQPGVGVLIIDIDGLVLYCNEQARQIYYGDDFDPVGMTIEEIEGAAFSGERMPVIRKVIEGGQPMIIRHIRGGKQTEACLWPLGAPEGKPPRIISMTRQGVLETEPGVDYQMIESKLVDLGPLDVLTRRELEVLSLVGHGVPLKTIAKELDVSQRTVERYRSDIARKLHVKSIADIARIVQAARLKLTDATQERLHRWHDRPAAD